VGRAGVFEQLLQLFDSKEVKGIGTDKQKKEIADVFSKFCSAGKREFKVLNLNSENKKEVKRKELLGNEFKLVSFEKEGQEKIKNSAIGGLKNRVFTLKPKEGGVESKVKISVSGLSGKGEDKKNGIAVSVKVKREEKGQREKVKKEVKIKASHQNSQQVAPAIFKGEEVKKGKRKSVVFDRVLKAPEERNDRIYMEIVPNVVSKPVGNLNVDKTPLQLEVSLEKKRKVNGNYVENKKLKLKGEKILLSERARKAVKTLAVKEKKEKKVVRLPFDVRNVKEFVLNVSEREQVSRIVDAARRDFSFTSVVQHRSEKSEVPVMNNFTSNYQNIPLHDVSNPSFSNYSQSGNSNDQTFTQGKENNGLFQNFSQFEINLEQFSMKATYRTGFINLQLNFSNLSMVDSALIEEVKNVIRSMNMGGTFTFKVKGKSLYSGRVEKEKGSVELRV
jgi:hypothetical protein